MVFFKNLGNFPSSCTQEHFQLKRLERDIFGLFFFFPNNKYSHKY